MLQNEEKNGRLGEYIFLVSWSESFVAFPTNMKDFHRINIVQEYRIE